MSVEVKVKHTTEVVIQAINRQIANTYLLSIKYKKFHWHVSGPFFKQLHDLFDMHHGQLLTIIDDLAERSRSIGGHPIATASEFINNSELEEAMGYNFSPLQMVEMLYSDSDLIIDSLHEDIIQATNDSDPGTADLFTSIVQTIQKQAWFLAETKARGTLL
ncbi:MAG: DNA starvation/stationary phase protection protein [Chloroherpetonaceae bacterium]|nr:DNA starvation/stationary phase protection protein [Chloroherpetonaceae bacterium]